MALLAAAAGTAIGCDDPPQTSPVPLGVLLSYSGYGAASSINSERALLMAVEAANAAGGVDNRPVSVVARDTQSDARKVAGRARELLAAGAAVIIGPDNNELAVELKSVLAEHTAIMPSFKTTEFLVYKPHSWFVMGAHSGRVACEIVAQLRADGRQRPLAVGDPNGYNSLLTFQLSANYGMPQVFLPRNEAINARTVQPITMWDGDAYVLAALPNTASSLIYTLAAIGALSDARRWYLSPTLHTPEFLETLPRRLLEGAHGVATVATEGTREFRARFAARWDDLPLDDAYPFYDAGAIAVLALERALVLEKAIPQGNGLAQHIVGVTAAGGTPVAWNEIGRGLERLRQRQEVKYIGLSGSLEFDLSGQTRSASTSWWTIGPDGFAEVQATSSCK